MPDKAYDRRPTPNTRLMMASLNQYKARGGNSIPNVVWISYAQHKSHDGQSTLNIRHRMAILCPIQGPQRPSLAQYKTQGGCHDRCKVI